MTLNDQNVNEGIYMYWRRKKSRNVYIFLRFTPGTHEWPTCHATGEVLQTHKPHHRCHGISIAVAYCSAAHPQAKPQHLGKSCQWCQWILTHFMLTLPFPITTAVIPITISLQLNPWVGTWQYGTADSPSSATLSLSIIFVLWWAIHSNMGDGRN